ncbi:MAG: class II fructose-bisphosphate aldolase [Gorillibacterium sp.]|nr:class II fructose-bisphosphate aldolase [Gorillibacterium sp.]
MALVTLKELMKDAQRNHYAVGMFNTLNLEMIKSVIRAAEEQHSPAIIAVAEVHAPFNPLSLIGPIMVKAAREAKVQIAVHLDHGLSAAAIKEALELGFTSVMYDGSTLDYEDNIAWTQQVVEWARTTGASVEAELGHVGGGEAGTAEENHEAFYTDVEQSYDFVSRTGCDALAVAIGTVHGVYRSEPRLDIGRLRDIHAKIQLPIVLHGGSGLKETDFRNCIEHGVSKINICTDMFIGMMNEIRKVADSGSINYTEVITATEAAVAEVVKQKMTLFGSNGRV